MTHIHALHKRLAAAAAVLILVGAACANRVIQPFATLPPPAATATLTLTQTFKPSPTGTLTPLPSLTNTPSLTPEPSPTDTLTPTAEPTATNTPTASATALVPMTLYKGPSLIYTGKNTEMKIFWQAGGDPVFQVELGTDLTYELARAQVNPADAERGLYSVVFSNLTPGTRYFYRLIQGQGVASGSFVAAPEDSATRLKFVSYGDTRHHPEVHNAVAGQVVALFNADPEYQTFNLHLGDLIDDGEVEELWQAQFFDPRYENIRAMLAGMAVMPARGNHEQNAVLFGRYFPMPYAGPGRNLSFDYGPVHVTILDQYEEIGPGSAQYEWLVNDLAASQKKWKFITLHAPGWTAIGLHNRFVREHLQPLMEQYGVSILFAGHDHFYARAEVNGVQHLTIGTGGAPPSEIEPGQEFVVAAYEGSGFGKFEIDGDQLTGWFIDGSGNVQDTFTVTR